MLLFRGRRSKTPHPTKAERRLAKDVHDLSYDRLTAPKTVTKINFPNGSAELTHFTCTVCPQEGAYSGGTFIFDINVPPNYPFTPPEVKCLTKVFHPNFHWQTGEVRIGLLDRDWKPVLSINIMILQLQLLFVEPISDLEHAVNKECCAMIQESYVEYENFVRKTLGGGMFFGERWEPNCTQAEKLKGNKRTRGKEIVRGKRRKHTYVEDESEQAERRGGRKKMSHGDGQHFLPPLAPVGQPSVFSPRSTQFTLGTAAHSLTSHTHANSTSSSSLPQKSKRLCSEKRFTTMDTDFNNTTSGFLSVTGLDFTSQSSKSNSSSNSKFKFSSGFQEEKQPTSQDFSEMTGCESLTSSVYSTGETTSLDSFVKKKRLDKDASMGPNKPQFMTSKERAEERAKICTVSPHGDYSNGALGAHPFMSPRAIFETRKASTSSSSACKSASNRVSSISALTSISSLSSISPKSFKDVKNDRSPSSSSVGRSRRSSASSDTSMKEFMFSSSSKGSSSAALRKSLSDHDVVMSE